MSAGAVATLGYALQLVSRLELASVDARFSIRGEAARPNDVVVVGIDDVTFDETGLRWPFARSVQAEVIDRLAAAGAKVIAEDIQYTEATEAMPGCGTPCEQLAEDEDAALAESVWAAGQRNSKVVLSTTAVEADGSTNVLGGNLRVLGARAANGNYIPDSDGVIRRFPHQIAKLETFPVVAAERALGHTLDPSTFPEKRVWIDFAGPPGAVPFLSFSNVLTGKFDPAVVRGKTVVVGGTDPVLQDVHATATSGELPMSGAEIQANAIHTVLQGFPLRSAPSWLNLLAIWILALTPPLLGLRLSSLLTFALSAVIGGLYAVVTQVAFEHGTVIAFIYPLGALFVSMVGGLGAYYMLAAFDRQRTRNTFARFVPEDVVDQVLAQTGGELRLGGVRVVGTCMFVDLRGSTQFAESLPPETVVDVINRYLGALTESILGHGGTLISYLGDGFMAVFGAPIPQEDHADRAVAAAREILEERLPRFNEWLREQDYGDDFTIGIGINTGPFMAGNVGSERRLEYTAMGDTINTASRLEGSTKDSGFYALIADSTREALLGHVGDDLVAVGEVDVRGRQEKVTIWSIEAARKPERTASGSIAVSAPGVEPS